MADPLRHHPPLSELRRLISRPPTLRLLKAVTSLPMTSLKVGALRLLEIPLPQNYSVLMIHSIKPSAAVAFSSLSLASVLPRALAASRMATRSLLRPLLRCRVRSLVMDHSPPSWSKQRLQLEPLRPRLRSRRSWMLAIK